VTRGGDAAGPSPQGEQALETFLRRRAQTRQSDPFLPGLGRPRADSIFGSPLRTPFGRSPLGTDPRRTTPSRGLYDRLRPSDTRRPF
jgi:hypothetical protein